MRSTFTSGLSLALRGCLRLSSPLPVTANPKQEPLSIKDLLEAVEKALK